MQFVALGTLITRTQCGGLAGRKQLQMRESACLTYLAAQLSLYNVYWNLTSYDLLTFIFGKSPCQHLPDIT